MTDTPSVFDRFRDDHLQVLARLDAVERAIGVGGRLESEAEQAFGNIVALLRAQFASHVTAEEEVLYPALVESFPESAPRLRPLEVEHAEMRSMLAQLSALLAQPAGDDRDEQLVVHARDLVDLLRIHIHKEEHSVFNLAARVLTAPELAKLAERVAGHRAKIDPESGADAGKGPRS